MGKSINRVAVLGAGTMGARIAAHLANAGVPCWLLDVVPTDAGSDGDKRNRIAAAGLEGARKSKPAAFFEPSRAHPAVGIPASRLAIRFLGIPECNFENTWEPCAEE